MLKHCFLCVIFMGGGDGGGWWWWFRCEMSEGVMPKVSLPLVEEGFPKIQCIGYLNV